VAPLNHLFMQGEVVIDALLNEPNARERLVAAVHARKPQRRIDATCKPTNVEPDYSYS
jgi:uncharacterized protein (TIGR04141 family)